MSNAVMPLVLTMPIRTTWPSSRSSTISSRVISAGSFMRVVGGQAVERAEEILREDGVDAVVDGVQVRGKRAARRVERGLVAGLDPRNVVFDGRAPALEARVFP